MRQAILLSFLFAAGCAHSIMRGSVVMKIDDREAHVCMGRGEVAVGDPVLLVRHFCKTKGEPDLVGLQAQLLVGQCVRQVMGRGQVVRVLNDHYSVVRFDAPSSFTEGDSVEKDSR